MTINRILAAGGEPIGGHVFLNKVHVGSYGADGFTLNEAGQKWATANPAPKPEAAPEAEEAKPVRALRKPKPVQAAGAEPEAVADAETQTSEVPDIDALLG